MNVLLTSPEVDKITRYLRAWSKNMIKECRQKHYYHILDKAKATRKHISGILAKKPIDIVLLNGHGANDKIAGHNNEIIIDQNNVELLQGKQIHALSCSTAKALGPMALANGAKSYIGYDEQFVLVTQEDNLSNPLKDETAALFLDAAFTAPKALLNGKDAASAVAMTRAEYKNSLKKALNSDIQSDNDQFIMYLYSDMMHLKNVKA